MCAVLTAVLAWGTAGCGLWDSGPDEVAREFLDAWAKGDLAGAARLTDAPRSAQAGLEQARDALGPEALTFALDEVAEVADSSSATASYRLDWRLPKGRNWRYPAKLELYPVEDGWTVHWASSVLHPQVATGQTLALREDAPALAPVLDRDSRKLLAPGFVVSIVLHPAEARAGAGVRAVASSLASALKRFDPAITESAIRAGAAKAGGKGSYLVAALREPQYLAVKSRIYDLPGVRFTKVARLLAPTREFGAAILPAVRSLVEKDIAGAAGWRVVALDASGAETAELHDQPAAPSEAVRTSLSYRAQDAAERALADVDEPAALVALRASTGDLLAVAQNEAGLRQGAIALTGRYPPGSTFKIATALAGLSAGTVTPGKRVPCPGTTVIGGRLIPNDDRFDLGTVSLSTAFARSCNTTFARLAADLPPDALTTAALDLGIGADFEVPGLTTITGSVPPAENVVQRAENGFGQGTTLASPFGMALAAATAATGSTPTPNLMRGRVTTVNAKGSPLPPERVKELRALMREVVTDGSGALLDDLPEVHGKTGTAQFGDGTRSHGWFVGFQGDLAFAVLLVGADSSQPAVAASRRFLSGLD